ncbi:MAG: lysophospholipid acyltransferase family protein [Tannerella sp.]|jgi:KDO2-lipid IV(A) lauroyltransferase|nr:lysophospholipid acyltransferase family protein [Tannerella sp.]
MKNSCRGLLFHGLYIGAYMLSLLPMSLLYKFADWAYLLMYHVFSYRKSVVIQNLSRSFPDKRYGEIEVIMKGFYRSFCDNCVEILKSVSIPACRQKRKIVLIDFDMIERQIRQGRHVIASMGHCGNWEILNVLPLLLNVNINAVYKPLKTKCVDRLMLKIRSRFGVNLIPAQSVVRHIVSNKDNPSLYFFIADQCPVIVDGAYRFDFLHQTTSVFSGVEKLAGITRSGVVYIHVSRISRGIYRIECKEISLHSESAVKTEITRNYIRHLEQNILKNPSDWLWSHKRWKR